MQQFFSNISCCYRDPRTIQDLANQPEGWWGINYREFEDSNGCYAVAEQAARSLLHSPQHHPRRPGSRRCWAYSWCRRSTRGIRCCSKRSPSPSGSRRRSACACSPIGGSRGCGNEPVFKTDAVSRLGRSAIYPEILRLTQRASRQKGQRGPKDVCPGMGHDIAGDGNRSRHLRPGLLSTISMRAPWRRATAATRLSPSPLPGVWRLRSSR